jgi:hypothetical protein
MGQGSIPCGGKRILSSRKCGDVLSGQPSLLLNKYGCGGKGGGGLWSSVDYLPPSVQRLRESGALPLLPTPS